MTATHTHVLRLSHGAVRIDVTETAEGVFMTQKGAKLRPDDIARFVAWVQPLLDAYADDPRPLEMSGEHVNWTGRVELSRGGWVGFRKERGPMQ